MRSQVNTRMRRLRSCGSPAVDARGRVRAFNSCEPVLYRSAASAMAPAAGIGREMQGRMSERRWHRRAVTGGKP